MLGRNAVHIPGGAIGPLPARNISLMYKILQFPRALKGCCVQTLYISPILYQSGGISLKRIIYRISTPANPANWTHRGEISHHTKFPGANVILDAILEFPPCRQGDYAHRCVQVAGLSNFTFTRPLKMRMRYPRRLTPYKVFGIPRFSYTNPHSNQCIVICRSRRMHQI